MVANIAVLLIVFSTYLINKSYIFMFFGGLLVFFLPRKKRAFFIDFYSLSILLFLLILLFFWIREVMVSGNEEADYFISSSMLAVAYFLIMVSVKFKNKDFSNLLNLLRLSLIIQALIILARFFGLFEVPVPFGVSDVNRGIVSLQVREQVTSASLALQVCSIFLLSKTDRDRVVSFVIATLALPAVLVAGSMLAFMVFVAIIVIFSYEFIKKSSLPVKVASISSVIVFILFVLPFFTGAVKQHYDASGSNQDQAVDLINKVDDGDAFINKILNRNTRTMLLAQSITFNMKDATSFIFGDTKKNFANYSGGFSPHSIVSETIALAGIVGLVLFLIFSRTLYVKSKLTVGANKFSFYYFLMIFAGTINSVNIGLPIFGLMLILMRPSKDKCSIQH